MHFVKHIFSIEAVFAQLSFAGLLEFGEVCQGTRDGSGCGPISILRQGMNPRIENERPEKWFTIKMKIRNKEKDLYSTCQFEKKTNIKLQSLSQPDRSSLFCIFHAVS